MRKTALLLFVAALLLTLALTVACGSGNSSGSSSKMATVNLSISDPPTCGALQNGEFAHIWIAIKDVKIHTSATAGDSDAGWVDLTPSLSASQPMQVDLLGIADSNCFLKELGSKTEIQPGTYQQIRVLLADNGTVQGVNSCGNGSLNCVQLNDSKSTILPLQLSSEAKTGMKIPSGQIAGGAFNVMPGQTKDLNIDFNACASIVRQGNGTYRLKPVLHAGEVNLTSQSVNGSLIDSVTQQPVTGKVVVALEQKDANGVDRVIMQDTPNALGQFVFCPVPAGTYDVVAVAVDDKGVGYAATIVTGVQPGSALGKVQMFAETASGTNVSTAPATIKGTITSTASNTPVPVDVVLDVLQNVTINNSTVAVTIPLALQADTSMRLTTAGTGCTSTQVDCVDYTVVVPAMNPTVAAFSAGGASYVANTTTPVGYIVEGASFKAADNSTATCSVPVQQISKLSDGTSALTVTPGATSTAQKMAFTGCSQ